jgi:hypothetical protein
MSVVVGAFAFTLGCASNDIIPKTPLENTGLRVAFVELEQHAPISSSDSFMGTLTAIFPPPGVMYSKSLEYKGHSVFHSKCLKEGLDHSNAFASINEEHWPTLQKKYGEYDLLITGALEYDTTTEYDLAYGLSLFGSIFSLLRAPNGWSERHMLIDISVRPPSEPYRVLYQKKLGIHGPKKFKNVLWYRPSPEEFVNSLHRCTQEENEAIDEIVKGVKTGGSIAQVLVKLKVKENH